MVNLSTSTFTLPTKHWKRHYTFPITLPNYHPNNRKETQILIFEKEKNPTSHFLTSTYFQASTQPLREDDGKPQSKCCKLYLMLFKKLKIESHIA